MLTYTFAFTSHAAGRDITVTTIDGATVDTGTVTSSPDETNAYVYQAALPEGTYIGYVVIDDDRTLDAPGQLDIPDSIAAGGTGLDPVDPQTITAPWTFDPPLVGTLDEFGNSDAMETVALTIGPKGRGTAALNIIKYDDTPLDPSGYGVAHIDSDGGGGLAGGAFSWSEAGDVTINNASVGGAPPLEVKTDGRSVLAINAVGGPAMLTFGGAAGQSGWEYYPYTDATADSIVCYDPNDGVTKRFRVTPAGEVHADGGVVLKSPNGTAYRLVVANDGTLSTEAV